MALAIELGPRISTLRRGLIRFDVRAIQCAVEDEVGGEMDKARVVSGTRDGQVERALCVDRVSQIRLGLGAVHSVIRRTVEDPLWAALSDQRVHCTGVSN